MASERPHETSNNTFKVDMHIKMPVKLETVTITMDFEGIVTRKQIEAFKKDFMEQYDNIENILDQSKKKDYKIINYNKVKNERLFR